MTKVGFIGIGQMATAILQGALSKGVLRPEEIAVFDRNADKRERFACKGCTAVQSVEQLVQASRIVFIAVKPQDFQGIAPALKASVTEDHVLVSIMAGVTGKQLQESVGFPVPTVLAMPNTPLLLGQGATALAAVDPVTREDFLHVQEIFGSAGEVAEIQPHQMPYIIPVNGSSPALIYLLAQTLVDQAVETGIPADVAMKLFAQSLIGSAHMLTESDLSPQELIDMVSSPGGTTIAGLDALREHGFVSAISQGYEACAQRAVELSRVADKSQEDLVVDVVDVGSGEYTQAVALREQVLRVPLNMKISEEDVREDGEAIHFVAYLGSQLVGTGQLLERDAFTTRIRQLAVDVQHQKSGVGKALMLAIIEYAIAHEYNQITLNARATAEDFYKIFGFKLRGGEFLIHGLPHYSMILELDDWQLSDLQ